MIISVMQPGYLPWLGFFELMARVDTFVIYDDVAYDKESWRNRNRIRTHEGAAWLTVPVLTKGRFAQTISEVEIVGQHGWKDNHLRSLTQYYSKAPYYQQLAPFFEDLYGRDWRLLLDLDMAGILFFKEYLRIDTRLVYSSELRSQGHKTARLVSICQELGADTYVSSNGAKAYLEPDLFETQGIRVEFQDYRHPEYPQLFDGFVSHLSVIDLLFNCGQGAYDVIMSGSSGRSRV